MQCLEKCRKAFSEVSLCGMALDSTLYKSTMMECGGKNNVLFTDTGLLQEIKELRAKKQIVHHEKPIAPLKKIFLYQSCLGGLRVERRT